ncbi:MAG: glycosyltransferase [Treponema sp.]|nr:glycosyltransferase [Treponema sp.]
MSKSFPLVSVIIPCYNAEKYVELAVRSIMNQTYKNLEILCCDDCSTDVTFLILQKLADEDSRIKLIKNETNQKIVKTLNKLIALANGKYIARMDADDISLPKRIEEQVKVLEKNNNRIVMCGCNVIHIDESGRKIAKTILPVTKKQIQVMKSFRTPFYHPSVMIKAAVLKQYKYLREFQYAEDYELWLRILHNYEAVNLRKRLLKYRIHSQQISKTKTLRQIQIMEKIYTKHKFDFLVAEDIASYARYVAANQKDEKLSGILRKCILETKVYKYPILFATVIKKFISARKTYE